jgi:hypothetical protein
VGTIGRMVTEGPESVEFDVTLSVTTGPTEEPEPVAGDSTVDEVE